MPAKEQVPRERYSTGERMKFLVIEVRKTLKGPAIIVSRAHPNLVRKLFELEVPEIYEGSVKIESVAREAGARTKISVRVVSDDRIDPVGACVGVKGIRVQNIVDEIRGEKVDIVPWDEEPSTYLAKALSPAASPASSCTPTPRFPQPRSSCPTTSFPSPSARRGRTPAWPPG